MQIEVLRDEKKYPSARMHVYMPMESTAPRRLENEELADILSRSLDLLEIQLEVIQGLIATMQELIERVHDTPPTVQRPLPVQREKRAPWG